ncbi:MAG: hypothetical protein GY870_08160, partial [archaeon]|nr:hypothetical protein [archaeon]
MVIFILVISEIDDFRENVKNKLPQGVHRTIDGIFDQMKHSEEICGPISEILIITPLSEIVSQLNTGEIKPVRAMKNLTQLLPWIKLFSDGIMNGIEIDPSLDEQSIKKMKKAYLLEVGSGKKVTLQSVLKTAAYSDCSFKPEPEIDFKDITTSNIIMALSEILANIEMMIEDIIQGSTEKIKAEKYDSVDIASISREGKWALQEIQEGRATHSTIPNIIFIKKKEINRALEIYRLFKPILKTAHIVVSSMPIFLTMLYEKPEKCNELLDDCNNIFTEFTCGAQLERLSISLKEKIGKNRSIEEIEINAAAITKNLKKIIDGLNIHILSNLRRMQIKTIISDKTFDEAKEIGIDFTGLACKFGIEHAPDYFDDIKLESTRLFSKETLDYTILV